MTTILQKVQKHVFIILLIIIALFLAHLPVILSNNYLRQDDLIWELWRGMKITDLGYIYYNAVFQLVRPVSAFIFFITDLISINFQQSVYVRLASIILISIIGILIYFWQLLFNNNRIFAATYAISTCTLPAFQIFAATANYFQMVVSTFLATIGMFFLYYGFHASKKVRLCYLSASAIALFISLLDYPLATMFGWLLITIVYLNNISFNKPARAKNQNFFWYSSRFLILVMIAYYFFIILFHLIFKVDTSFGRSATISNMNPFQMLYQMSLIIIWHSNLWFWKTQPSLNLLPAIAIFTLLQMALYQNRKIMLQANAVILTLLILAYSPALVLPGISANFRYSLVTMPILLYLIFWGTFRLSSFSHPKILGKAASTLFIVISVIGVSYANWMLASRVVGPYDHDFKIIEAQLVEKVIPLLNQNKFVLIQAINCDSGSRYYEYNAPDFEYGMRICQYPGQIIGAINHIFMKRGYTFDPKKIAIVYKDQQTVITGLPWNLVANNGLPIDLKNFSMMAEKINLIKIDTRDIPTYHPFDFYRHLLKGAAS